MEISPTEDAQQAPDDGNIENGKMETTPQPKKKKEKKFYCPHNLDERDTDQNTAIHVAILSRKLEHVKLLIAAGASIHKKSDGSPPVHAAISVGSIPKHTQFGYDCLVLLHENEVDFTEKDDSLHTPLYLACTFNLPQIVRFILSTEAGKSTLNSRSDRSGGRPLHAAAKFDSLATNASSQNAAAIPQDHKIFLQLNGNMIYYRTVPVGRFQQIN